MGLVALAVAVALLLCAAALLALAAAARRRRATADLGIVWAVGPPARSPLACSPSTAWATATATLGSTSGSTTTRTGSGSLSGSMGAFGSACNSGFGSGDPGAGPPVLQLEAIAAALQARVGAPSATEPSAPRAATMPGGFGIAAHAATTGFATGFATGIYGVDVRGVWLVAAAGDAAGGGCHAALCSRLARGDLALGRARWWGGGTDLGGAGGAALSTLPLSHALDLLPTLLAMRRDGGGVHDGGGSGGGGPGGGGPGGGGPGGGGGAALELLSRALLVVRFGVVPLAPPPSASAALARTVRGPPVSRLLAAPAPLPRLVEVQLQPAARPGHVKQARVSPHAAATTAHRYVVP